MTNLFLFGSFNFWEGMARVLDVGGTMVVYNESPTIEEADRRVLSSDWQAVGDDLRNTMTIYAEEQTT
jgi:hypothetical protein